MKRAILIAAAFVAQITLGWPVEPAWLSTILVPMVFIVAPPLLMEERRWPHFALVLGLAWDLVFEPVVGPGAIAWSAAAVTVSAVVPLFADRSPRAWFTFGAVGATLMIVVRHFCLIPLGLATDLTWRYVLTSALLTSFWCGLVGWVIALDLPTRWDARRARKLR